MQEKGLVGMDKEWYTVEELAQLWELKISTIRTYIRTGQLVAVRFGNTYRIEKEAVQKFIAERRTKKES